MKYKVILLVLCVAAGWLMACSGSNTITHTNTVVAESPGWSESMHGAATGVNQLQGSFTAVLGDDNSISQSNTASAYGSGASQRQENSAVVVGVSNIIDQLNEAVFVGDMSTNTYKEQVQRNIVLIMGNSNTAAQSNTASSVPATVGSDVTAQSNTQPATVSTASTPESPNFVQVQSNIGVVLGNGNWLQQSNRAFTGQFWGNPFSRHMQRNTALAINSCEDCELDITVFSWIVSRNLRGGMKDGKSGE